MRLFFLLVLLHPVAAVLGALVTPWAPVVAGLSLGTMVVLASAQPGWAVFGPAISRGASGRTIALTFDDGPDPRSTLALLDALNRAGARATFFVLVDRAEQHPELLRAIAAGHEVALHGPAHHPWLTVWRPARGAEELTVARQRLTELCGQEVRWYRPPFGGTSPRLAEALRLVGLQTVWCSVRTMDGGLRGERRLLAACRKARGGDIVLMHEGPGPAVAVLPAVLDELAARGLRSVTVAELLDG